MRGAYTAIPSGRYALWNQGTERWHFFRVSNPDKGKWYGWTFLTEYSDENEDRVRGPRAEQILKHILANPLGSAKDYGKQKKTCGKCGLRLTDPESIARGIGPVCAQKY